MWASLFGTQAWVMMESGIEACLAPYAVTSSSLFLQVQLWRLIACQCNQVQGVCGINTR